MAPDHAEPTELDPALSEILADWLEAAENCRAPEPREFLELYPRYSAELERCLGNWQQFQRWAGPLRAIGEKGREDTPGAASTQSADAARAGPSPAWPSFPDYEILAELGRGGMGVVYKARQKSLNRLVALKVLRVSELGSAAEAERFRNEAALVAQLDHPHVVPIYEVGEYDGRPYFSMKLIDGGGLKEQLPRFRADPRATASLLAVVARALHHAHQHGILHRDLKPSNILLDSAGQPHVTDFGLAKRLGSDSDLTQTGVFVGTPSYMSPEQAFGRRSVTTAADVYGLGSILYALLTGRPPFHGDNVLLTLEQVREGEPEPPSAENPRVDPDLQTICLKCLEKDPWRRYGSAEALADDLERWLKGEPIHARPARTWERIGKWARRRPAAAALVIVSTAAALAFVVGAGLFYYHLSQALTISDGLRQDGLEREANMRRLLYVADLRDARQSWESGNVPRALDILHRYLPRPDEEDLRGWEWHYLKNCCRGEKLCLRGHNALIHAMDVSRDERWLVSSDQSGVVKVWDLAAGRELCKLQYDSLEVNTVAFAPDGRLLATAGQDRRIHLWDTADWTESRQLWGHEGIIRSIAFSPDGALLASGSTDEIVHVWDVANGRLLRSWKEADSITGLAWSPDGRVIATCSDDKTVKLWEAATGRELCRLGQRSQKDLCLQFAADGTWLAAGGYDQHLHVWDVAGSSLVGRSENRGNIRDLAVAPTGRLLAGAEGSSGLSLWHVAGRRGEVRLLRRHTAHAQGLHAVRFANQGRTLLTAAEDGTVKTWDLAAVAGRQSFPLAQAVIGMSTDHRVALLSTKDGKAALWDLVRGTQLHVLAEHAAAVSTGVFSSQGDLVATMDADHQQVLVSDVRTGQLLARHAALSGNHCMVSFSPDGAKLANAGPNKSVQLVDPRTGAVEVVLKGHVDGCTATLFSPDGLTLASCDAGYVRLWDCRTATCRTTLHHGGNWLRMAFSPDGSLIATGGTDPVVKVWDARSGRELATLSGHNTRIYGLAFSPDGKTLASTSKDGTAKLWHLPTGKELFTLVHGPTTLRAIGFTAAGELHVVADQDAQGIAEVLLFDGRKEP